VVRVGDQRDLTVGIVTGDHDPVPPEPRARAPVRQLRQLGGEDRRHAALERVPDALPGDRRILGGPHHGVHAQDLAGGPLEVRGPALEEVAGREIARGEIVEPEPGPEPEQHRLRELDAARPERVRERGRAAVDAREVLEVGKDHLPQYNEAIPARRPHRAAAKAPGWAAHFRDRGLFPNPLDVASALL
jgi:hypothetical protein